MAAKESPVVSEIARAVTPILLRGCRDTSMTQAFLFQHVAPRDRRSTVRSVPMICERNVVIARLALLRPCVPGVLLFLHRIATAHDLRAGCIYRDRLTGVT